MGENTPLGRGHPDPDTANSQQPTAQQQAADTETTLGELRKRNPPRWRAPNTKALRGTPPSRNRTAPLWPTHRNLGDVNDCSGRAKDACGWP